jgi:sugar phosphate isomerase/epimerase
MAPAAVRRIVLVVAGLVALGIAGRAAEPLRTQVGGVGQSPRVQIGGVGQSPRVQIGGVGQSPRVQIGWCTPLKTLEAAKAAGFDYAELGTTEIATMSDGDFEQALQVIKRVGLPVPVMNLFLPGTLKVTGPQVDAAQQLTYVRRAFDRLAQIGTHIVVFGSGGARRIPDGFSKEEAFQQLVDFGRRVAPEAQARGITLAIEPLRRQESNIINTAAEGLDLVDAIGHPNFQLMIDFYHLANEKEDPAIVARAAPHLRHLHTANPKGRVFPTDAGEFDYAPFFTALQKIGYDQRISVEASTTDFAADAPKSIALLKALFAR